MQKDISSPPIEHDRAPFATDVERPLPGAEPGHPLRELTDDAFSRAAGAPLIHGNRVELLRDARENYPAWLRAIRAARHHVYFENYFICDDEVGRELAEALIATAGEGVKVRLIYDWMGNFGKASRRFWQRLIQAGVDVRCYNPPKLESPFGWLSRDHRKMLAADGEVAFITGLCVGRDWVGDPARGTQPWRDTGVEVRGRAVPAIERAFARIWAMLGSAIDPDELSKGSKAAGGTTMRVVATEPATAGMLRLDQLVATLATSRLWLTDAYYAGTTSYVQALRAAAKDGIDVRLLVPNATDVPLMRPLSRSGYRPLLEAGVRVFEWNGTMLHAKTAVADGSWSRVGSTNLNLASWFGNCELDAVIEDAEFAETMETAYIEDLDNATEIVLDMRRPRLRRPKLRRPRIGRPRIGRPRIGRASEVTADDDRPPPETARTAGEDRPPPATARTGEDRPTPETARTAGENRPAPATARAARGERPRPGAARAPGDTRPRRGSAGRAAAGALRIGNTIGAAFTDRRVLGPVEARLTTFSGLVLVGLGVLFALFPRALAYPIAALALWGGAALLYRGYQLWRERRPREAPRPEADRTQAGR